MKKIIAFIPFIFFILCCSQKKTHLKKDFVVTDGQMPNIVLDQNNTVHLVYGIGDSIMYISSSDNAATFSKPALIKLLPKSFSYAMRGPQIVSARNGLVVTACTTFGNIYSFYKEDADWKEGNKVNDTDSTSKEGLMALSADGENAYAVWLDLRGNLRNKIYGAKSIDGGKTWSKNTMVYTSPDTSVCECCKPSVVVKGNNVYVMFRNWLQGNRDLYVIQSADGGNTFGQAQKLGNGHWKLDGCPMDGGGLTINKSGEIQTVWRRESKVFAAMPGMPEKLIGEGRGCTIEALSKHNVYAWSENGSIIFLNAQGQKKILGKGSQPLLKALSNEQLICVWESEKQIHAAIVK